MKLCKKFLFLYALITVFYTKIYAQVNHDNDFQIWLSGVLRKNLSKKWEAELMTEYRFGNDAKELFFYFFLVNFSYKFNKWIDLIPGYRQIWRADPLRRGQFNPIYDPMFAITGHIETKGWKFLDRNRIELFSSNHGKLFYTYRNRLTVITPVRLTKAEIVPYTEEEFFWTESRGIDQNRFIIGGRVDLKKGYTGVVYYLLRHTKPLTNIWTKQHVLGLRLDYRF